MSPSDHFMAANVVFVVTFQFLLCFLAHVATKTSALALLYGLLNSTRYLGCFDRSVAETDTFVLRCGY